MRPRTYRISTLWMTVVLWAVAVGSAYAQGSGTLPAYAEPTIISSPNVSRVDVVDCTGDGVPDFLAIGSSSTTITATVYPGLGDGTFGAGISTAALEQSGSAPRVGDFNGDGIPDVAYRGFLDFVAWTSDVMVAFGNGNGSFQPSRVVGTLPYEARIQVGDFDGDGRTDLAAAGCTGGIFDDDWECGLYFFWGRSDGNVDTSMSSLVDGTTPWSLFSADLTGDGIPEMVASYWDGTPSDHFDVFPGLGGRAFGSAIPHTSAGSPGSYAAADFDADGKRDLAVLYADGVGILHGNGGGTFQAVTALGPWNMGEGMVSGTLRLGPFDINGDGRLDLAVDAGEGVAVFVQNPDGSFRRYALTAGNTEPHNYTAPYDYGVSDFNADGRMDFVVAFTDGKLGVYLGLAAISTSLAISAPASTLSQSITLTATVTPAGLTGPVTFYDGAHVLGSGLLASGQAVLTTRMLPPGAHSFRAAYSGTLVNAPVALSSPVAHTVGALPASTLRTVFDADPAYLADGLAAWDFDRDGSTDLLASAYH